MIENEHSIEMYNERENLRTHLGSIGSKFNTFEIQNVSLIGDVISFSVDFYSKAIPVTEINNDKYEVKTVCIAEAKDVHIFEVKITTPLSDK